MVNNTQFYKSKVALAVNLALLQPYFYSEKRGEELCE